MLKSLLSLLAIIAGFVARYFKRRDAQEPQTRIDKARTDAATGNDAALNADLDGADQRLRDDNESRRNSK